MQVRALSIPDVKLLEPKVFGDERGFFFESFNQRAFAEHAGVGQQFVQDNHSRSARHVLRGLHYQNPRAQGKLVRVLAGTVFDVAVDLRKHSPSFGQWIGATLSSDNHHQIWIPGGFAHGFLVLSDVAEILYKTTDYWSPEHEHCIAWDDPELGIAWPLDGAEPVLSARDRAGRRFAQAVHFD